MPGSFSRFKNTQFIQRGNVTTYGRWTRPSFLDRSLIDPTEIQKVKIDQTLARRPDLIALKLYGIPELDWVITMFNRPLNTLGWPKAGIVIEAPTKKIVMQNL
jgi:hypothetical protein